MSEAIALIQVLCLLGLTLGVPAALTCFSVLFAVKSAPRDRYGRVARSGLARGAALTATGLVVLAVAAWSTREDRQYDDFGSAMTLLAGIWGASLLILGLGPFTPWLLGLLGRNSSRLPAPLRPPTRHLTENPSRTALGLTTTVTATTIAIATMITAAATTAHNRAEYEPKAPLGTFIVERFQPNQVAALRAAIERDLPGVPVTQNNHPAGLVLHGVRSYDVAAAYWEHWENVYTGDRTLLHYLTGEASTPYDEQTVVLITADGESSGSAEITYGFSDAEQPSRTKTVPARIASPAHPRLRGAFIPAKLLQNLGFYLEPTQLIIDPALHRTTADEQDRLTRRLGEVADTYVERGPEEPSPATPPGWAYVVSLLLLVATAGTLAATRRAGSARVLLRLSGGSPMRLRFLNACRAAYGGTFATVLGACAGCVIGLLLAWPATTSSDWEPPPRTSFDTPWPLIAALIIGLPVLSAAIAAFVPPRWLIHKPICVSAKRADLRPRLSHLQRRRK